MGILYTVRNGQVIAGRRIKRDKIRTALLAKAHEALISYDAGDPGCEGCFLFELIERSPSVAVSGLDLVLPLRGILQDRGCQTVRIRGVANNELRESLGVLLLRQRYQFGIVEIPYTFGSRVFQVSYPSVPAPNAALETSPSPILA